jgi:DNA-binding phage protein
MKFVQVAADWLRFIRGRRSQRAFSKRLGYRSNIAYRWECQMCFPTAAETFAFANRSGVRGREALGAFYGSIPSWAVKEDLATRRGVAALLRDLRGKTSLVELAARSGYSRFSIGRWMSGAAAPKLPEFLAVVEAATFRCVTVPERHTA